MCETTTKIETEGPRISEKGACYMNNDAIEFRCCGRGCLFKNLCLTEKTVM